ncbi:AraC family transcriptional regulator [Pseudofrankia inefficax]|uniref:Transcriptional regulator, AraC family n=1 Tax=Pseudofrankia inefficax (strain DSM 45817 / CECT 9037 / DDB 130130 / EuI1c) TaxID=298654 RepID=E3IUD1_PSEI1|nr:AraC family transcriptional regulator [Pseudofrankia inefficax]ADP82468.1 transcriptional regulator, AraC family [Pseudofrankia inefficax]
MDVVAGLLNGPRAHGAFLLRSSLTPPWSLRIQDEAPLTLVAVVRGEAWVIPDGSDPVPLCQGDVAILRGPDPYTFADDPATPPQVVIHPGQRCTTPDGEHLAEMRELGVRTWGNSPQGATVLVTGTYQVLSEICRPLLDALPVLLVLPGESWDTPLIPLLASEVGKDDPGQEAVLDRLLDLLLIAVLRTWFARPDVRAPAWYQAHSDPVVGGALRLLHDNPAHPWTVAELAAATHVSRAALARRFTDTVGQPPMAYLTAWRLALAADLLRPGTSISEVAAQVGYGSSFALCTAFKRVRGISPREHRARAGLPQAPVAATRPWPRQPA